MEPGTILLKVPGQIEKACEDLKTLIFQNCVKDIRLTSRNDIVIVVKKYQSILERVRDEFNVGSVTPKFLMKENDMSFCTIIPVERGVAFMFCVFKMDDREEVRYSECIYDNRKEGIFK